MKSIKEADLSGVKRAIVRVDFNIPLNVTHASYGDLLRIHSAVETISHLERAGVQVVLMTHLGRKGESVSMIESYLREVFPEVVFGNSWNKSVIDADLNMLEKGKIYMLPNVRTHPGEESDDSEFVNMVSSFADIYVNDAFSASHREHASIVGIPKVLPSFAGIQLCKEIDALSKLRNPEFPVAMIIGGAKIDTKMPLIEQYLIKGADIYVVGALAHPIYKARGLEIGMSLCDSSGDIHELLNNDSVVVPNEVVIENDGKRITKSVTDVQSSEKIQDASRAWVQSITGKLQGYKTIIWNGPLGLYEKGYTEGTQELLSVMKTLSAYRVIGGGDTVACISENDFDTIADFVSTGGGAMLEYLLHGTLPGIEALK